MNYRGLTRRRALAVLGGSAMAALSGCSRLTEASENSGKPLRFVLTAVDGPLSDRYLFDVEDPESRIDEAAFEAAMNGESYTTAFYRPFPRRDDGPVYTKYEGTYYRLDDAVVGEKTAEYPILRLYEVGRESKVADVPKHVDGESLPEIDKRAATTAYFAARARGNVGGAPGSGDIDGAVYRQENARERSRLLASDAPSHLAMRDKIYRIETGTRVFRDPVYRPLVTPLTESESTFVEIIDARFVDARLDEDSLTDEQRAVLGDARGEGYEAEHPYPEPAQELLREMGKWHWVDGDVTKDGFDRHDVDRGYVKTGSEYYRYLLSIDESPKR